MKLSLKQKLLISNIGLVAVFGLALLVQFNKSLSLQETEIRKNFKTNSSKLAGTLAQNFYYFYHNVQAIGKNEALKTKEFDKINFFFNELVSVYPSYDLIVLSDLDGNYVASNSLSATGEKLDLDKIKTMNFSGQDWFKNIKSGQLTEDSDKKIYGSLFGPVEHGFLAKVAYGKDRAGFYVSTPVTNELGDNLAVLTTYVNAKWVRENVVELEESMKGQGMEGAVIRVFQKDRGLIGSNVEGEGALAPVEKLSVLEDGDKKVSGQEQSQFDFFAPSSSPLIASEKISNTKFLDSLDWNIYVEMDSKKAFSAINESKNIFGLTFAVCMALAALVAWFVARFLTNQMVSVSGNVDRGANAVMKVSDKISDQAHKLSVSTNQLAESLHETVSSLNEMSAMVSKSASHSQNSKDLSSKSRESANDGMKTVEQMLEAIEDIAMANKEIVDQLGANAREMNEITTVIREIEDKTKVINDIVFQTKLLSFNASVEAARAGEHGKGFSVVAEEVGTLAKSSGDAANEIEEMLNKSIARVNKVVEETQSRVEGLIAKGAQKVEVGRGVSGRCKEALERILEQSANLDIAIEEIATASTEQSQGIQEISRAMDQLNDVTRQNSEIAKEVSNGTDSLNQEAGNMGAVSRRFSALIYGKEKEVKKAFLKDAKDKNFNKIKKSSQKKEEKRKERKGDNLIRFERPKAQNQAPKEQDRPQRSEPLKKASNGIPNEKEGEWEDL